MHVWYVDAWHRGYTSARLHSLSCLVLSCEFDASWLSCHLVGKTLRNVFHGHIAEIRFVGELMIIIRAFLKPTD